QARDWAKATGPLAKTDVLAARTFAFCRCYASGTAAPTRRAHGSTACPAGAAAAPRSHADRRTAPSRESAPAAPDGHPGAHPLAQYPPGSAGRRPGPHATDPYRLAGA